MPKDKKEIDLEKYLKNPDLCPFCGSEDITAGHVDCIDIKAWRNVRCISCKEEWVEEFTITNVKVNTEDL